MSAHEPCSRSVRDLPLLGDPTLVDLIEKVADLLAA